MDQVTSHILMVRPSSFGFNAETAINNTFQKEPSSGDPIEVSVKAREEFDAFVEILRREGVDVTVLQDTDAPQKPDAIFPNNWVTFHGDGTLVTYPMYSPLRRLERREDLPSELSKRFFINREIHLEEAESENRFLEGTGSMVLDRVNKIAYACISQRTDKQLLETWCSQMGYTPFLFHAVSNGTPIYHTNVMMAIGSKVAIVCLDCLPDLSERNMLRQKLSKHHDVVEISNQQVDSFAGNMLAIRNDEGEELMVMSATAEASLTEEQRKIIEESCRIVSAPIPTIESIGGGSARCMIAEIFLPEKKL